ncbi:MAG: response regulator [Alphaproteobacteria bacterium]
MSDAKKILVVEDNDFVRMQIVKFLHDAGYEISEAKDGEEALQSVNSDIAIAIVDVRMEPMGGFEFIRSIRGSAQDVPVILVTGDDNLDMLNDAAKWGVDAVLMKPVQRDRLVKMVERIIRGAQKLN